MITQQIIMESSPSHRKSSGVSASKRNYRLQQRLSIISNKIPRNNSPYLGYLRHAPITSKSNRLQRTDRRYLREVLRVKASPYIGFMRHAPPAVITNQRKIQQRQQKNHDCGHCENSLCIECEVFEKHKYVARGGLPGGNSLHESSYSLCRWFEVSPSSGLFMLNPDDHCPKNKETNNFNPLATLDMFNKLAYWFLFPVANDHENIISYCKDSDNAIVEMKLGISIIQPFLTSLFQKLLCKYTNFSISLGNPTFEESSCSSMQSIPSMDVNSLEKAMLCGESVMQGSVSFQSISTIDSEDLRRHLDIDSIAQLPMVTYDDGSSTNRQDNVHASSEDELEDETSDDVQKEQLEWSWITVPKDLSSASLDSMSEDIASDQQSIDDNCIICLSPFQNGDRLRVLPCKHRFHTSCIDKWLSGSFSYDGCHTGVCPTCKTLPTVEDDDSMESMNLDGEVPAWAFERLGSRIAG